ncbi:hypothetical protein [Flavobacterium adhaerens]|uniref:hypothetical protein n=1 Tax=Flavobacterium adhaerens TaxID=3149043 RepID=UPI0032B6257D
MTLYNSIFENFNKNYFGAATLAIIGQSCLGAAAAMFVLSNGTSFLQMVQLTLIVLSSMFANTSILAQFSRKVVFNLMLISVFISIILIIVNNL